MDQSAGFNQIRKVWEKKKPYVKLPMDDATQRAS